MSDSDDFGLASWNSELKAFVWVKKPSWWDHVNPPGLEYPPDRAAPTLPPIPDRNQNNTKQKWFQ